MEFYKVIIEDNSGSHPLSLFVPSDEKFVMMFIRSALMSDCMISFTGVELKDM